MRSIVVKLAPLVAGVALAAGCQGEGDVDPANDIVQVVSPTINIDSFFSDANGWTLPSAYTTIRYQNVGYDLKSDVCGRKSDGVHCALDFRGAFVDAMRWNSIFTDANGWGNPSYYATIKFPDLDGDRQMDICSRAPNLPSLGLSSGIVCGLSNGSSGFVNTALWSSEFSDANGWSAASRYTTIRFPDLDGNGKADVCGRSSAGIRCGRNFGSNFDTATTWSTLYSDANGWTVEKYYSTIAFPDLDGDGDNDVCGRGPSSSGTVRVWCALSNGSTGFGTPSSWNTTFGDTAWDATEYYSTIQFADVNGDGKEDMCGRGPGGGTGSTIGMWCALSTGTTFSGATLWTTQIGSSSWNTEKYYSTIRLGKGYVCGRGGAGVHCAFSNDSSFKYMILDSSSESDANGWTDPKYYKTIGVSPDFRIMARGGSGMRAGPSSHDNVSIRTPAEADARRTALIEHIWGQPFIDTNELVDSVTTLNTNNVNGLPIPSGTVVHRFTINMPNQSGGVVYGQANHYIPPGGPSRLVILNPGHVCSFTQLYGQGAHVIVELLNEGYGVLATYMPLKTPEHCNNNGDAHESLFADAGLPVNGRHPYAYFLDPVRRGLNQALWEGSYSRVDMAGLSGGGWTTTMYAALDTRIQTSVPIAGSEPFYVRPWQDAEQNNDVAKNNDFFGFSGSNGMVVTGYKDLYVLGAYGPGRRQIQVLNRNDNCCFSPNHFAGEGSVSWEQSVRSHELEIRRAVSSLGTGSYRLEIHEGVDTPTVAGTTGQPHGHEFSKDVRTSVILGELNGSHSLVGAPPGGTGAFARRMNGNLQRYVSGTTWEDSGLPMVGTPAVLSGVVSTYDAFYRNPSNVFTHASKSTNGWQALTDVSGIILNDPVAVSWGTGRIDVVVINSAYQLRHWWRSTSGTWSSEQIGSGTALPVLAVGQPSLTTWGANRLDVFYRRIDSTLAHAFTNSGSGTWTIENVTPPVPPPGGFIKNFPTSVATTNVLLAYVMGRDDKVYQIGQSNGGPWTSPGPSISVSAGAFPVWGSPSAVGPPATTQNVYVRFSTNLIAYTQVPFQPWAYSNFGQPVSPFISSPYANTQGAFIVDSGQNVWRKPTGGGAFVFQAGYVDR